MQRYVLIPLVWVNLVQYSFDRALDNSVSRSNHFLSSGLQIASYFSPSLFGLIFLTLSRERSIQVFESSRFKPLGFSSRDSKRPLQLFIFSASFAPRLKRSLWLSKFRASSVACTLPLMANFRMSMEESSCQHSLVVTIYRLMLAVK